MSFQNSTIFPFPAVQYIPLTITNLMEGPIPKLGRAKPALKLMAGPELTLWQDILNRDYGIDLPNHIPDLTFPVLAIHLKISVVKYRSFFVTMLGSELQDYYQFFTIPADRFYKSKLFLQVFDPVSTTQLAEYSLFIPQPGKPATICINN